MVYEGKNITVVNNFDFFEVHSLSDYPKNVSILLFNLTLRESVSNLFFDLEWDNFLNTYILKVNLHYFIDSPRNKKYIFQSNDLRKLKKIIGRVGRKWNLIKYEYEI